jgi:hypothetical protein
MSEDNKRNLVYFEHSTMRDLYLQIDNWQTSHRKRLQSVAIHKDGDMFCCIALTNPAEVIITDIGGESAWVTSGALRVHVD